MPSNGYTFERTPAQVRVIARFMMSISGGLIGFTSCPVSYCGSVIAAGAADAHVHIQCAEVGARVVCRGLQWASCSFACPAMTSSPEDLLNLALHQGMNMP